MKNNILFLNPIEGILKPQSFLIWNAIKKCCNILGLYILSNENMMP
ncbi:hypothetical protein ACO3UB_01880 [Methanocaldococcus sp. 16A]